MMLVLRYGDRRTPASEGLKRVAKRGHRGDRAAAALQRPLLGAYPMQKWL